MKSPHLKNLESAVKDLNAQLTAFADGEDWEHFSKATDTLLEINRLIEKLKAEEKN